MGGTRTNFHYSDEGLIGEYDAAGVEIKTYGYKPGSTWTTDPLFMKVGSNYYFYQNDHLGTPQKLTSTSGAVAWSAKYASFGEATIDPASTVTSNLRFAGQYYDDENSLHFNWFRYYDPPTGRYIRSDPVGLKGGTNLFVYAIANPITLTDRNGLLVAPVVPAIAWCLTNPACQAALITGAITTAYVVSNIWDDLKGDVPDSVTDDLTDDYGDDGNNICEQLNRIDTDTCNGITRCRGPEAGARCHASASQRYAECLRNGVNGVNTPLDTWNN